MRNYRSYVWLFARCDREDTGLSKKEVASVIVFFASGIAPQTTGNTIDLSGAAEVR